MTDFPRRIPVTAVPTDDPTAPLVIDCSTCVARHSEVCDDCVVTFLCSADDADASGEQAHGGNNGAIVLDLNEIRALKALGDAGLVPTLRHRASG
ncbi:MAG: hypothetical protein ACKOCE_02555 [Acidimicrobiia bacterium]